MALEHCKEAPIPQKPPLLSDPAGALTPLLRHRLIIVTGKGGTGKTTVAATLGWAAAQAGLRVLVAELGRDAQLPRLLSPEARALDHEERQLAPGITAIRIDPYAALAEYLGLQIGIPAMVRRVLQNTAFRQLLEASPGWRELITLGKVWQLEQMMLAGAPKYDLIVVDAPATGHGMTLLDVPRVVVSTVRAGPLRHHTERVEALLADRERTLLLPVSQAEELPFRETCLLVRRVREELSVHVDRVVVNGVHAAPLPKGLEDLPERILTLYQDPVLRPFGILGDILNPADGEYSLPATALAGLGAASRVNSAALFGK